MGKLKILLFNIKYARGLKKIRKAKRMSVPIFASVLGCTVSDIYDFERGKKQPSLDILTKMIKELGVDVNWLFSGKRQMFLPEVYIEELKKENEKLNKEIAELEEQHRQMEIEIQKAKEEWKAFLKKIFRNPFKRTLK